ncbi:NF-X1-type zinc finger-containing protein [Tieghemostelium lacteum]|uniref:NF-X1-type zinc finger-containing protein n=1 Tax=Tieghemostelium lacteum TaxID=361077 RepID=A0A152A3B1_TIELA|nr:NF-X1-type zinc finger-containing protein [Tieghemostelium lacteum]|eukprot:KYR00595.1 NF-X1-type zinc finger-containing protein [Tieghemostelium lacteum]
MIFPRNFGGPVSKGSHNQDNCTGGGVIDQPNYTITLSPEQISKNPKNLLVIGGNEKIYQPPILLGFCEKEDSVLLSTMNNKQTGVNKNNKNPNNNNNKNNNNNNYKNNNKNKKQYTTTTTTTRSSSGLNGSAGGGIGGGNGNVREWDINKVSQWLVKVGLGDLVDKFKQQDINGQSLLSLNEMDYVMVGIVTIGKRKMFQEALKELKKKPQFSSNSNSPGTRGAGDGEKKFSIENFENRKINFNDHLQNKTNNYEKFTSDYSMEMFLYKRIEMLEKGQDIVQKLYSEQLMFDDIINRPNISNEVIDQLLTIFTHEKVLNSLFQDYLNTLYSMIKKSDFLAHANNLCRYIQSVLSFRPIKMEQTVDLFNHVAQRFKDGADVLPLYILENAIQNHNEYKQNEKFKFIIDLINKKKIQSRESLTSKEDYVGSDNHQPLMKFSYKSVSIVPEQGELRSKRPIGALRPLKEGTYTSGEEYLDTHFMLLREDMIRPLKDALDSYEKGGRSPNLYRNVQFLSLSDTQNGLGFNISFESQSKFKWEKCSKLLNGSLVCLSCDNFETVHYALVEKRPEKGNTYQITIVFYENQEFDMVHLFNHQFIMLESPTYFEAYKNILLSLQSIDPTDLPFSKYLLNGSTHYEPPKYIKDNPLINFGSTFRQCEPTNLYNVLNTFPKQLDLLDDSQMKAMELGLKTEISLIQGPPGTGKSFIGLKLYNVIQNHINPLSRGEANPNSSPILLICYTNHALDQFLRHVIETNPKVNAVRIGARSKEPELAKYNIRRLLRRSPQHVMKIKERDETINALKYYVKKMNSKLDVDDIDPYLTEHQKNYLSTYRDFKEWCKPITQQIDEMMGLVKKATTTTTNNINNLNVEDEDEEDEDMVKDMLNERSFLEDEAECILGDINIQKSMAVLMQASDSFAGFRGNMRNMAPNDRVLLYRYWYQEKVKTQLEEIKTNFEEYTKISSLLVQHENEAYRRALIGINIVAATITGASRIKRVFDNINSKVLIIEEAAEVLESQIVAVLPKTIQHLIMIGDHEQLKPSCAVYQLAQKYNLSVSLFERIIKTSIKHVTLSTQRRMVPNISQFVKPIYPKGLLDHHSTIERFNAINGRIRGVKSNLFFMNHLHYETISENTASKANLFEAEYCLELAHYLVKQNYEPSSITILTFYTGQLLKLKSQRARIKDPRIKEIGIRTVDQFQGEENDIIILSTVRSNNKNDSGFVKIQNRINVALSRARNGLFILGNAELLANAHNLWKNLVIKLKDNPLHYGNGIPVMCENHAEFHENICEISDFNKVPDGGCNKRCSHRMDCGHQCPRHCHSDDKDHMNVTCTKPCEKIHEKCGHVCPKHCGDSCGKCNKQIDKKPPNCYHVDKYPCYMPEKDIACQKPCEKTLKCGHKCPQSCYKSCINVQCAVEVMKTLPCGHSHKVPCFNNSPVCTKKCHVKLECGHICNEKCKDHKDGKHPICTTPCQRILMCGHSCSGHPCNEPCKPCAKKCENKCPHSKCSSNCSSPCQNCKENCLRKCTHRTCTKKCFEKCNVEPCDQPCQKLLKCKHPCMGFCGDHCPSVCKVCSPDHVESITRMKLSEFEPEDRFVKLTCGHCFESSGLDQYMNMKNDGQITTKKCPECQRPIYSDVLRYKDQLTLVWKDIEIIKMKLLQQIAAEEKSMVVKAMGGAQGKWFKCSNGHPYYIGECGGAMEKSICPECKTEVGGSNHQLVQSNSHAPEMDGSIKPLYQAIGLNPNNIL